MVLGRFLHIFMFKSIMGFGNWTFFLSIFENRKYFPTFFDESIENMDGRLYFSFFLMMNRIYTEIIILG